MTRPAGRKAQREEHDKRRRIDGVGTLRGYLEAIPGLRESRVEHALLVPQARWVNDLCLRSVLEPTGKAIRSLAQAEIYRAALAAALAAAEASIADAKQARAGAIEGKAELDASPSPGPRDATEVEPVTIFESRWKNAVLWAKRVNLALSGGDIVFVGQGEHREEIEAPLQIRGDMIFGPFGPGSSSGIVWFRNDPECDEGLHTEIDEWNVRHKVFCYASAAVPLEDLEVEP